MNVIVQNGGCNYINGNLLDEDDSSPDFYLKNCYKFYDNKKII